MSPFKLIRGIIGFCFVLFTCVRSINEYRRSVNWYRAQNQPIPESVNYYKFDGIGKVMMVLAVIVLLFLLTGSGDLDTLPGLFGLSLFGTVALLIVILLLGGFGLVLYAKIRYPKQT